MANFSNIVVGGVLMIKDTSFMKEEIRDKYKNTYAVVMKKDADLLTVMIKLFDGKLKWVKVERVTDTFEIIE